MPPSAMASKITPASWMPDCGRASRLFSIIIPVTGRLAKSGAICSPVSGEATVVGALGLGLACLITWIDGFELGCTNANHSTAPTPNSNKATLIIPNRRFLLRLSHHLQNLIKCLCGAIRTLRFLADGSKSASLITSSGSGCE